jgi:hypothetical protein
MYVMARVRIFGEDMRLTKRESDEEKVNAQ